jgi:hypothetical protein
MLSTIYQNKTEPKFLKIVESLKLKGYKLIKTEDNFFIWQKLTKNKKPAHEYIRLTLIRTGWYENTLFYWNLETSYKPFNYDWNHRAGANIQSEYFKANAEDLFFNRFLEMIDKIKEYVKGGIKTT